jgi:hypothetical protein
MITLLTQPAAGGRWHIVDDYSASHLELRGNAELFYKGGSGRFLCTPYTMRHIQAPPVSLLGLAHTLKGQRVCRHCSKKLNRRLSHQQAALDRLLKNG